MKKKKIKDSSKRILFIAAHILLFAVILSLVEIIEVQSSILLLGLLVISTTLLLQLEKEDKILKENYNRN